MVTHALKKSLLAGCILACALAACHREPPPDPELATPKLAVASLRASRLYFNPVARAHLMTARPELLAPDDRDARSERSRLFAQASQNPRLWRQMDRREHFDTVLLSGDPALCRPLLEHLGGSTDWTLTYLDHTSVIFGRAPAQAWKPADLEAVRQKFAALPPKQHADFLVQLAVKLLALNQRDPAKAQLDEALRLDEKSAAGWTALAVFHAQLKQHPQALAAAEKALTIDKKFRAALEAKAQLLLAMRRANEACEVAQALVDLAPGDTSPLFILARSAHEAHAYTKEIATLAKLIGLLQNAGQPVSACRIYLGQAYAENGDAAHALDQFQQAAAAEDLDSEQRAFVHETIQRIKQRSGL